jgi:hypothetical protein
MTYKLHKKTLPKGICPLIRHHVNSAGRLVTYKYYQVQIYKDGKVTKHGSFPMTNKGLGTAIEILVKNKK